MATDELREEMATAIEQATHMSLHIADPGDDGGDEVTGGTPAYARVAITAWNPGTTPGVMVATLAGPFNVPPSTDVTHAGLWNGSVFLDSALCYASTIGQEVVTILMVAFVVGEVAE